MTPGAPVTPETTPPRPDWVPDVLPGHWRLTLPLGPDPDGEGDLVATVVRRGEAAPARHAVLALHGFTDYYFNTEFADHLAGLGFAFYALDLHKCGRSRLPGQTPHFTTDLARYDADVHAALAVIAADTSAADTGGADVCLYGHSAGGLILALWCDRHARDHPVSGLILNSPFLDLHGPAVLRSAPTSAALGALARWRKAQVVRRPTPSGYGTSLHRDYAGEFDYDLLLKPVGGFPVTAGWIHAIRRGHARLHRGLDVGVPNLVLRSDHSVAEAAGPEALARGDAVLDVAQIARWAGCLGNHTTVAPIRDAKHDVFLSLAAPRAAAYAELDRWYARHVPTAPDTARTDTAFSEGARPSG